MSIDVYKSQQTTGQIRCHITLLPTSPPILTWQITAGFQLSQETWNHLSNQKSEMAETNRLIKKAVKICKKTYKCRDCSAKKTPTNVKSIKKKDKIA